MISAMWDRLVRRIRDDAGMLETDADPDRGQGLVEYALLLIFVAVVVVAILVVLSPGINNAYSNIIMTL